VRITQKISMLKRAVHTVTTELQMVKQNKIDLTVTNNEVKESNRMAEGYEAGVACIVPRNVALGKPHPNTARSNPPYTCRRGCLSKRCNRARYSSWKQFVCEYQGTECSSVWGTGVLFSVARALCAKPQRSIGDMEIQH
jgi:hypothetical protein